MEKVVRRTIKQYNLLSEGDGVVVGFSGGADSSALLFVLKNLASEFKLRLAAVHVNHGIRGEEAQRDANAATRLCETLGIACYLFEEDVPKLAKTLNLSLEQAGREIRYKRFEEVRAKLGYQKIALAHHRDDQGETILFRLIRGTGLEGLSGMAHKREDNVIRPLLSVSRKMIETYCQSQALTFVTDSTNLESAYSRNFLRLKIIPDLEARFKVDLGEKLSEMANRLRMDSDFIEKAVDEAWREGITEKDGAIYVQSAYLKTSHKAIATRLIRRIFKKILGNLQDFGQVHVNQIMQLTTSGGYRIVCLQGVCCESSQGVLRFMMEKNYKRQSNLSPPKLEIAVYEAGEAIEVEALESAVRALSKEIRPWVALVDAQKIKGELTFRHRKSEDRFVPLGFYGHKKIKDFFIDEKIPKEIRDEVWLLCDEEKIIWVCGYRLSEEVKVTSESRFIQRLTLSDVVREH